MSTTNLSPLRVLIIDDDPERRALLVQGLRGNDCYIMERETITLELLDYLPQLDPDVIVIDADSPDRDMLEHVCSISRDQSPDCWTMRRWPRRFSATISATRIA